MRSLTSLTPDPTYGSRRTPGTKENAATMSDIPFHTTTMGRRFYERDVFAFIEQLRALNANLERIAKALERRAETPEATK
jgi:hypothetical protein